MDNCHFTQRVTCLTLSKRPLTVQLACGDMMAQPRIDGDIVYSGILRYLRDETSSTRLFMWFCSEKCAKNFFSNFEN